MRRIIVVVMNGAPMSGKTTIQESMLCQASAHGCTIISHSSVEVPYKCMSILGWNGVKDDQFRADMVALKRMYIRNCDGPITDLTRIIVDHFSTDGDPVIIITDIREADEIHRVESVCNALLYMNVVCEKVLVRRPEVEGIKHGNESDDDVFNNGVEYDIICHNDNNGMDNITKIAHDLINVLLEGKPDDGEQPKYPARIGGISDKGAGRAIIETPECG